jgi:hypothetical protein
MSDVSKGSADDPVFKTAGLVIDIISKVLLGIAAAYFTYVTYQNSVATRLDAYENECTKNVSHLFDYVFGKDMSSDTILGLVNQLVRPRCEGYAGPNERTKLVETLSSLTRSEKIVPTAKPTTPPGPPDGWVAVGFVGTSDFNFTKVSGDSITDTSNLGTIKSKWQVNVRRKPADWQSPLSKLDAGDCFAVTETKLLDAGGQKQLWANGRSEKCR